MREPHHHAVVGIGGHGELARHAGALDHQRVIARRLNGALMPRKMPEPLWRISDSLPCTWVGARTTLPPKASPIAWWPRQTPRIGIFAAACRDQIEADAGLLGRAGAGRQHDGVGVGGDHGAARHLVVAMHLDLRPQLTEIVHQVEGEAVVIVDQADHRKIPCFPAPKPRVPAGLRFTAIGCGPLGPRRPAPPAPRSVKHRAQSWRRHNHLLILCG